MQWYTRMLHDPLRIYFREFVKTLSLLSNVRALSLMEIIMFHCHKQTLSCVCESFVNLWQCVWQQTYASTSCSRIWDIVWSVQRMARPLYWKQRRRRQRRQLPFGLVANSVVVAQHTTTKCSRNMANDACQLSFVHATCKCVLNSIYI